MSTYYSAVLIVGASLNNVIKTKNKKVAVTRYNEITGVPSTCKRMVRVVSVNGKEFLSSGYCILIPDEGVKHTFQSEVEALYPGLTFVFAEFYEEEGVLGVVVGKEIDVGPNATSFSNVSEEELQKAFEKFKRLAPGITPRLKVIMLVS